MKFVCALLVVVYSIALDAQSGSQKVGSFTVTKDSSITAITHSKLGDAAFAWGCMRDGLNVIYMPGGRMVGDEDEQVLISVGLYPESLHQKQYWALNDKGNAAFMPVAHVADFTAYAKRATKIVVQLTYPYEELLREHGLEVRGFTHEFEVVGLEKALSVMGPCKTKP